MAKADRWFVCALITTRTYCEKAVTGGAVGFKLQVIYAFYVGAPIVGRFYGRAGT